MVKTKKAIGKGLSDAWGATAMPKGSVVTVVAAR